MAILRDEDLAKRELIEATASKDENPERYSMALLTSYKESVVSDLITNIRDTYVSTGELSGEITVDSDAPFLSDRAKIVIERWLKELDEDLIPEVTIKFGDFEHVFGRSATISVTFDQLR